MFKFANPKKFQSLSRILFRITATSCVFLFAWGLYLALVQSPPDKLQSDTVRIMYTHVPAAWLAMGTYSSLGFAAISLLIWKHILAGLYIRAAAPIGAAFTAICLITGSIWGQPTWGTWWVWDARLTSVLVLFFLYVGIIALGNSFDNKDKGMQATAWLTLIGAANLPIIKFSVDWWNTLHQSASISSFSRLAQPAIDNAMLWPLLVMAGAYATFFIALTLMRMNNEIASRRLEIMKARQAHG